LRIGLDDISAAAERIAGYVERTPLRLSEWLSSATANVFCKLEVVQPTSSFKIRGAFNAAIRLSDEGKRLAVTEMTQQQKIAAALSKAGMSNPAAWGAATVTVNASAGAAKAAVAVEAQPTGDDPNGFDLHPPVVLMKGSHDPAFFISWRSQRDVIASLGWKSTLMIWGGPALTILCVYLLLAHFNRL